MNLRSIKRYIKHWYITRWIELSILYSLATIFIYSRFSDQIKPLLTPYSILLTVGFFAFSFLVYKFLEKETKGRKITSKNCAYHISKRFLFSKGVEIVLQQFLIILLFNLSNTTFPAFSQVFFIGVMFLVHLLTFVTAYPSYAAFVSFASIPGAAIFYSIYSGSPQIALGLAYSAHLAYYLLLGLYAKTFKRM